MALLWARTASKAMTWEQVQDRHPIYKSEVDEYGEEHNDFDFPLHALAHGTDDDPYAEEGENSYKSAHDLDFTYEHVDPHDIKAAPQEPGDPRVNRAREGYEKGHDVPPPLLVKRAGEYHVADGHHRTVGARKAGKKTIKCIVAHSPMTDRLEY